MLFLVHEVGLWCMVRFGSPFARSSCIWKWSIWIHYFLGVNIREGWIAVTLPHESLGFPHLGFFVLNVLILQSQKKKRGCLCLVRGERNGFIVSLCRSRWWNVLIFYWRAWGSNVQNVFARMPALMCSLACRIIACYWCTNEVDINFELKDPDTDYNSTGKWFREVFHPLSLGSLFWLDLNASNFSTRKFRFRGSCEKNTIIFVS